MDTKFLRWSLSFALGAPAMALAVGSQQILLVAIGATEAVGAVLLQPRRTRLAGAALLLLSLVGASGFHAWLGELPPPAFLVYVAAIAVVVKPC